MGEDLPRRLTLQVVSAPVALNNKEAALPAPSGSAFAAMIWAHLANDGLANYLPGILPAIAIERHIPVFLLGFLISAQLFGQMLQPLAGIWADRIGGRALMLGGPILAAVATLGVSYAHSFPLLAISLFLTGIGSTIFHPQALAGARALAGRREGISMSGFLVGGELGRAVGPLAAGVVVAAFGGLDYLWLIAVPVIVTWPWLLKVVPPLPARRTAAGSIKWATHIRPAASLLTFTAFRAGSISTIVTLIPLIWKAEGGSLVAGASLVTTLIGVGIIGNIFGGVLRDRFGGGVVLWGSSAAALAMVVVLVFVHGFWLWPVLGIMGIAFFSTGPVTMLIGQDIFSENPALGSGIALGLGNGLGAVMLLPISYAAQRFGLQTGLELVIVLLLISMIGVMALRVHGHTRSPSNAA